MKTTILLIFIVTIFSLFFSCTTTNSFKKDKTAFDASAVIAKYKAIGDLNDSYFTIKENDFFEFYMQLFDSVKNTSYPGKYSKIGDTLFLNFYNKGAAQFLGNKALINTEKKEIVFFDKLLGIKRKLLFN
ncbi:MAG: hypothetical protein ABL929_02065 [Ferruginibacter sp.]|nr:hypothetical protein [Ferruginibacter sp.]